MSDSQRLWGLQRGVNGIQVTEYGDHQVYGYKEKKRTSVNLPPELQWYGFCVSLNYIIKPDFGSNTSAQIAPAVLKNTYQSSLASY